jgi:TRAP-type mannitol/chloroaromatic compound transport system substrate-binding protein
VDVGYYGDYCFEFQKAVSGWWIGRKDESLALFNKLKYMTLPEEYKVAVENNLRNLDAFL